ncbi:hypothetical protein D3C83_153040 [compost metagenome]
MITSPFGSVKRKAKRFGRCCSNSPFDLSVEPSNGLLIVCSNDALAVLMFA